MAPTARFIVGLHQIRAKNAMTRHFIGRFGDAGIAVASATRDIIGQPPPWRAEWGHRPGTPELPGQGS